MIKVIRTLEYYYDSFETWEAEEGAHAVPLNGAKSFGPKKKIISSCTEPYLVAYSPTLEEQP